MSPTKKKNVKESDFLSIRRIRVDGLFGHYRYDLIDKKSSSSPLLILYGDNGSGKTTLLKATFYLLSNAAAKGHKSTLALIPFRRLRIDLGNSISVVAERSRATAGRFRARIVRRSKSISSADFAPNRSGKIRGTPQIRHFIKKLTELNVSLFFVSDDRETISNVVDDASAETDNLYLASRRRHLQTTEGRNVLPGLKPIDKALISAIQSSVSWAREQVRRLSQAGDADVTSIYTEIVRRAAESPAGKKATVGLGKIYRALEEQKKRSLSFASLGLVNVVDFDRLLDSLKHAKRNTEILQTILTPYIDALNAKLDALQVLHDRIDIFVRTINSFYEHKKIHFNVNSGLEIHIDRERDLEPHMLSSGEKQLLLLFSNTLLAREEGNIFIIDEPELSLNIKWQRRLLDALLRVAQNRKIQYLLATHSFELLAPHEERVLSLTTGFGKSDVSTTHA